MYLSFFKDFFFLLTFNLLLSNFLLLLLSFIFKLTDRGASRSYFKNFCPRPRPRAASLSFGLSER